MALSRLAAGFSARIDAAHLGRSCGVPQGRAVTQAPERGRDGVLDRHPDIAYSGGITGTKKIADYAALTRIPVGLHSGPCSLIRFYTSAHLSGAIQNFFRIENVLGEFRGFKEKIAAGKEPVIRKGVMEFPDGRCLGLQINEDWLRQHMAKGETWWG